MQIEQIGIDTLIPFAKNSRTHSDEQVAQIAASIREFGFTNPVLIDERDGIIAGHGRVMAARKLKMAEVPCIRLAHLSDAQKRAYVIADNKLALNAGWDDAMLKLELADLKALDFDLDLTGFTSEEIGRILAEPLQLDAVDEDVPEPPKDARTQPGDVWLLERHKVVCGSATAVDDWVKLTIGKPALVFTSPPYGVGENAKLRDKYVRGAEKRKSLYASHEDDPAEWLDLMREWTNIALTYADCVICNVQSLANNKRNIVAWQSEYADHLVDVCIWDKGCGAPQMQRNVLTNVFEWLFILSPESDASRAVPLADFHGTQSNVVRIGRGQREYSEVHRATMPVELAEWAVRDMAAEAEFVIDPFGGTGTTLMAAEMYDRTAGLIELDPKYVDVIVQRWQDFTGKQAVLESTGEPFTQEKKAA